MTEKKPGTFIAFQDEKAPPGLVQNSQKPLSKPDVAVAPAPKVPDTGKKPTNG